LKSTSVTLLFVSACSLQTSDSSLLHPAICHYGLLLFGLESCYSNF
jgi:hypothetical protein